MYGGDGYWQLLVLLPVIGLIVGFVWVRRITTLGEDPDRSFARFNERIGRRWWIPRARPVPTRGWMLTRGAILIGVGAVALALVGPQVFGNWNLASEKRPLAILMWIAAILAAVGGTAWMIRIAVRGPEDGAPGWRSRR
jgi:hypothetical protein